MSISIKTSKALTSTYILVAIFKCFTRGLQGYIWKTKFLQSILTIKIPPNQMPNHLNLLLIYALIFRKMKQKKQVREMLNNGIIKINHGPLLY